MASASEVVVRVETVELARAVLCMDCQRISNGNGHTCPMCASTALMNLAGVLERETGHDAQTPTPGRRKRIRTRIMPFEYARRMLLVGRAAFLKNEIGRLESANSETVRDGRSEGAPLATFFPREGSPLARWMASGGVDEKGVGAVSQGMLQAIQGAVREVPTDCTAALD